MVNEAAKEHFNMLRELLANVNDSIRIEFIKWYNLEGWGDKTRCANIPVIILHKATIIAVFICSLSSVHLNPNGRFDLSVSFSVLFSSLYKYILF